MKSPISEHEIAELPPRLRLAFAPLDKAALGVALGVFLAGTIFLVTAYHLLFSDLLLAHVDYLSREGRDYSGGELWLLANYFAGYDPESWSGAGIGALWGLWVGFVVGWFLAFARNFIMATWLFLIRTRERMAADREFLDHI